MFKASKIKRGFTLIEMLIVIAIIGILAGAVLVGLGPVQKSGRDARRISDLRQVQNALELYYNKNNKYPDGLVAATTGAWDTLATTLTGAGIGVKSIPKDPRNADPYFYRYVTDSNNSSYLLGALLEDPNNPAISSSWSGTQPAGSTDFSPVCKGTVSGGTMYCQSL